VHERKSDKAFLLELHASLPVQIGFKRALRFSGGHDESFDWEARLDRVQRGLTRKAKR
jgi:hypothetical protein